MSSHVARFINKRPDRPTINCAETMDLTAFVGPEFSKCFQITLQGPLGVTFIGLTESQVKALGELCSKRIAGDISATGEDLALEY